jgi:DNA-3-methyladenine glycosylase I
MLAEKHKTGSKCSNCKPKQLGRFGMNSEQTRNFYKFPMTKPNDSHSRCPWCLGFPAYIQYHDTEWGVPVWDDRVHFEFLILESAQAGLSWATILKKREGYRKAFADFDYKIVAEFPESYVQELLTDPSIIRNALKIRAAINNARCFMQVQEEFGSFSNYIWGFVGGKPIQTNSVP